MKNGINSIRKICDIEIQIVNCLFKFRFIEKENYLSKRVNYSYVRFHFGLKFNLIITSVIAGFGNMLIGFSKIFCEFITLVTGE